MRFKAAFRSVCVSALVDCQPTYRTETKESPLSEPSRARALMTIELDSASVHSIVAAAPNTRPVVMSEIVVVQLWPAFCMWMLIHLPWYLQAVSQAVSQHKQQQPISDERGGWVGGWVGAWRPRVPSTPKMNACCNNDRHQHPVDERTRRWETKPHRARAFQTS